MTDERVLDVTDDEPELVVDPSDGEQGVDDDIERMARERVEIENIIKERESQLEKIGEISEAHCTEFSQGTSLNGEKEYVKFTFRFPDGTEDKVSFRIEDETQSLNSFLARHDADSVTDMVGATHGCIYTDNGWQLHKKQSPNPKLYHSYVTQGGDLFSIYWPPFVLSGFAFIVGALFMANMGTALLTAAVTSFLVVYGAYRSAEDKTWS